MPKIVKCKNQICAEILACKELIDENTEKMATELLENEVLAQSRKNIEENRRLQRNRRKRERKRYGR